MYCEEKHKKSRVRLQLVKAITMCSVLVLFQTPIARLFPQQSEKPTVNILNFEFSFFNNRIRLKLKETIPIAGETERTFGETTFTEMTFVYKLSTRSVISFNFFPNFVGLA